MTNRKHPFLPTIFGWFGKLGINFIIGDHASLKKFIVSKGFKCDRWVIVFPLVPSLQCQSHLLGKAIPRKIVIRWWIIIGYSEIFSLFFIFFSQTRYPGGLFLAHTAPKLILARTESAFCRSKCWPNWFSHFHGSNSRPLVRWWEYRTTYTNQIWLNFLFIW